MSALRTLRQLLDGGHLLAQAEPVAQVGATAAWLMKVSEPRATAPPKLPNIGR